MARKYAVVGCGVAGVTASQFIRETDERGEIRIFTDEKYPFYSRMRLPEVVAGRTDPERLFLKGLEWFREMGIHFHPQEPIEKLSLNPLGLISSKAHYEADTFFWQQGGMPSFLPFQGLRAEE